MTLSPLMKSIPLAFVAAWVFAPVALAETDVQTATCGAVSSDAVECVAVDADSLKKFLEDQPKTAAIDGTGPQAAALRDPSKLS